MHELLAPAGTFEALEAAIMGGADAVYLGGSRHNARLGGKNFTDELLLEAIRYCHARHKKVYLTLNTLLTDKELSEMPAYASFLAESGIDAVIVQDIGLASFLHRFVPDLPLHASTQMTIHNAYGLRKAQELGFTRAVLAREAFSPDLIRNSPIEIEVFIHGALCVSYSGQCYFSSMLARRSGNRGTCAQPCRHKYQNGYALSLHDLCLAQHIPALKNLPIASLKIEGRLKSPQYVQGVVSLYRRLLDENRSATREEMDFLTRLFSRQGFTDGYFTGKTGKGMFGYRTEADKKASKDVLLPPSSPVKIPLSMDISVSEQKPVTLSLTDGVYSAKVEGEIPEKATNRAITKEDCEKSLLKLGGTPYAGKIQASVSPGLFLSAASVNALRRKGIDALAKAACPVRKVYPASLSVENVPRGQVKTQCIFQTVSQIPESFSADFIWLPLFASHLSIRENTGVILPTILFDAELEPVKKQLLRLKAEGLRHVMCQTIGQSLLCRELGLVPHGGTGMHILNGNTAAMSDMASLMASPELSATQICHMPKPLPLSVMVYGRHTLMTMENCLAKVHAKCHDGTAFYPLTDEKGNVFPVLCHYPHRNEVLNARPLYMLDKLHVFERCNLEAFVLRFTTESKAQVSEILQLYKTREKAPFPFTRGGFFTKEASE